jgi:hypothetical protein
MTPPLADSPRFPVSHQQSLGAGSRILATHLFARRALWREREAQVDGEGVQLRLLKVELPEQRRRPLLVVRREQRRLCPKGSPRISRRHERVKARRQLLAHPRRHILKYQCTEYPRSVTNPNPTGASARWRARARGAMGGKASRILDTCGCSKGPAAPLAAHACVVVRVQLTRDDSCVAISDSSAMRRGPLGPGLSRSCHAQVASAPARRPRCRRFSLSPSHLLCYVHGLAEQRIHLSERP